jgi:hypothetical protein
VPGEGRASAAGWRNLAYIAEIRWIYNCSTSYGHALAGAQRRPAMHRILHHAGNGQYFCPICNEPVKLETAKADEDGHPVHEDCYLDKLSGKIPVTVRRPPAHPILIGKRSTSNASANIPSYTAQAEPPSDAPTPHMRALSDSSGSLCSTADLSLSTAMLNTIGP